MISALLSRLVILVCGTLYPAYSSYKAVKTKDIKLYVKWMMYWIVFALFTAAETFTDIFLSFWFPFYYELKVGIVLWLLSPWTRGSSIMYRKVIHPLFMRREQEIDDMIAKAKEQGYNVIFDFGCKGMNLATQVIMNTAVKGGTGLLFQLRKSYSLNDLITNDITDNPREKQLTKRMIKDCQNNFRDNEAIMRESKLISTESQADLNVKEGDSNIYFHEYSRIRKSSCESMTLEKDCDEINTNLRPRRSSRQEADKSKIASPKPIFPHYPFLPHQNYSVPPFLYYPASTKTDSPLESRNFNVKEEQNKICEKFPNMKITSESYRNMKKANSTPDISVVPSSSKWMLIDSNPSVSTMTPTEDKEKRKSRRKKTAPKPPNDAQVPSILVNPSNSKPSETFNEDGNDVDYLAPYKLRPRRQQKSKIQQFLTKSRELLTQWKQDGDDLYSIRSENVDGSSDDSISTTSSYNTVN